MKKTAIRFGLYGIYVILAIALIDWVVGQQTNNYDIQEVIGWAGIILSVSFVFFGLKYYRDRQNGGVLGFGEGLKMGLLITLFPALLFAIYNVIYVLLDPQFLDNYYNYKVSELKKSLSGSELDSRIKEMEEQRKMFGSPIVQFIVMFFSVLIPGLIVTVISTLVLKRKAPPAVLA